MKRLLKKLLKPLWQITWPVRRPLANAIHKHVSHVLEPILTRLDNCEALYDSNLVLNSVVRELARLQMQIEVLQRTVQHFAINSNGWGLPDTPEQATPPPSLEGQPPRMMAG